jgi:hypothetical protein
MFSNAEYNNLRVVADRLKISTSFVKPPQVTSFEVFKLDTDEDPIGWQNVKLEDRVVFVSSRKSMIMSRDELSCNKELIRGNSIYFALTFPWSRINPPTSFSLGMFCLTDSNIKYFSEETSEHGVVSLWFVPSLW